MPTLMVEDIATCANIARREACSPQYHPPSIKPVLHASGYKEQGYTAGDTDSMTSASQQRLLRSKGRFTRVTGRLAKDVASVSAAGRTLSNYVLLHDLRSLIWRRGIGSCVWQMPNEESRVLG